MVTLMSMLRVIRNIVTGFFLRTSQTTSCIAVVLFFVSGISLSDQLRIGDQVPDFTAQTTQGELKFYEWAGDGDYIVFFSHPKDFTPVCTTEVAEFSKRASEYEKLNTKLLGLSIDSVDDHTKWTADIQQIADKPGEALPFPMIGDEDLKIAKLYGMLSAEEEASTDRTAKTNMTARNVFIIGPDKKLKALIVYPMTTGRNFDEIERVLKSIQLTAEHGVATPANWIEGKNVVVNPGMSTPDAEAKFTTVDTIKLPSADIGKPDYLRLVADPSLKAQTTTEDKPTQP